MRPFSKHTATVFLGVLIGTLATVAPGSTSLASDAPKPTFLESGDNDLIRFQMGDVPEQAAAEPSLTQTERAPAALLQAAPTDTAAVAARAKSKVAPSEEAAESLADTKTRMRAQNQSDGFARNAVPLPAQAPTPAPAPQADAVAEIESRLSEQQMRLYAHSEPQLEDAAPGAQIDGEAGGVLGSSLSAAVPQPQLDEAVSARLVTVCLNNPEDASGAKAFDIRRNGPPRYIAGVGASTCARFEPTRHTLYLWKTNDIGALSLILSNRLDLNNADGTQVSVDWLRDK